MNDALLTVAETAKRLNVSKPTVYRRIAEGSLPAVRVGDAVGPLHIIESELQRSIYRPESGGWWAARFRQAGFLLPR
jgi:excisionase family DNA binding protein